MLIGIYDFFSNFGFIINFILVDNIFKNYDSDFKD